MTKISNAYICFQILCAIQTSKLAPTFIIQLTQRINNNQLLPIRSHSFAADIFIMIVVRVVEIAGQGGLIGHMI